MILCVLMVLGLWVIPCWLDRAGYRLADQANEQLRQCRDGLDAAASAEARFAALAWFPGYGLAAQNGRRALLLKVTNGVAVCSQSGLPPAGFVDGALTFVLDRLPAAVDRSRGGDLLRFEAEEKLHQLGRDREIVALAARLPKGGQVTERVRACL
ncbi:MAG: hypothetical protein JXB32_25080, partial [Deltaproteobacteria bacterium]|nr:hypothetical protein [Deltaproteobacteria bacterium]